MKRLWILNHYGQEPNGVGGTRHYHLAKNLLSHGWKTTIIAASVESKTNKQRLNNGEKYRLDQISDVSFLWVRTPRYKGNGVGRILNMLTYSFNCLIKKNTQLIEKPDIIIGSSVHPLAALSGSILAKRYNVPFVFEVRDLWPKTLIDLGKLKEKSILTFFLKKLEVWLYHQADKIITLLPEANQYIVPLGVPKERIIWIPNGFDLSIFPPPLPKEDTKNFTFMYFGAFGKANGLSNIIEAASIFNESKEPSKRKVSIRFIGDGPEKENLEELVDKLNINNITFEPPVLKKNIPKLASEADAFIFNLIDAPVFSYGISSNKLFDFMASGRPIIFSCRAANNPIKESSSGITVDPDNPALLAEAMTKIFKLSSEEKRMMSVSARNYVEKHHDFRKLARKLHEELDALT